MIVPDALICSLSNKTSTSQSKHWYDGVAAHSSCPTGRQIHQSTNARHQISALQAVLNGLKSGTRLVNLGPEREYELGKSLLPQTYSNFALWINQALVKSSKLDLVFCSRNTRF